MAQIYFINASTVMILSLRTDTDTANVSGVQIFRKFMVLYSWGWGVKKISACILGSALFHKTFNCSVDLMEFSVNHQLTHINQQESTHQQYKYSYTYFEKDSKVTNRAIN